MGSEDQVQGVQASYRFIEVSKRFSQPSMATDMTHFFYRDAGWSHAVVVIDCWNREVIVYWVSKNQNAQVAVGALEDALIHRFHERKDSSRGVILRSDNGLTFSLKAFLRLVNSHGLKTEYITPYTPSRTGLLRGS